jgi:membrane protease YdiL (CAAX protease family)
MGMAISATPRMSSWIRRHPILAYFIFAFAGTWLFFTPTLLSQRGLGWINLPDAAGLLFFFGGTYTGPLLAGFVVTAMTEGKPGVRQLVRRILQWRVGIQWYALLFLGYPAVFILGLVSTMGTEPINQLLQNLPTLLPFYVINIVIGIILPGLGEETGWRGVALPRLQRTYGPLAASLALGVIHALWHLPAYFIKGAILANGFEWASFIANSCAIVMVTLVWTWLFNNAKESILFAILIHSTSNATSALIPRLVSSPVDDPWFVFKVAGIIAIALVVLTRGRLGFHPSAAQTDGVANLQAASRPSES